MREKIHGSPAPDVEEGTDELLRMLREMLSIRAFETAAFGAARRGEIHGSVHPCIGQEAVAVGICEGMLPGDLLTTTHRGHGHCLARGMDPGRMMAELFGKRDGYCGGKGGSMHLADVGLGVLGADAIVGGGVPVAVGAATAVKLEGKGRAVVTFFGDGAVNQGVIYESLNFAAVHALPVVFVCENNFWSITTPSSTTTSGDGFATRARSFGLGSQVIDGNDVRTVAAAAEEAFHHARTGLGPVALECQTYRWTTHAHFKIEENRPEEEVAEWMRRDPIMRARKYLEELGGLTETEFESLAAVADEEAANALNFARQSPYPNPTSAYDDVLDVAWT